MRKESGFHKTVAGSLAELQFEKSREVAREQAIKWMVNLYKQHIPPTVTEFHDNELDIHLSEEDLKRLAKENSEK